MTKVIRSILLWLMLLALPVQGMAQVSMFACHLKGDGSAMNLSQTQMMDHAQMDHLGMDHSMPSMHAELSPEPDSAGTLVKSLHGCCNCAPTCAVMLASPIQSSFSAIQHESIHVVVSSQPPHSADSRRIDRPPKTHAI